MNGENNTITFTIKDDWVEVYKRARKIILRARNISKPHPVPGTHRDKLAEISAKEYVIFKMQRTFEIL